MQTSGSARLAGAPKSLTAAPLEVAMHEAWQVEPRVRPKNHMWVLGQELDSSSSLLHQTDKAAEDAGCQPPCLSSLGLVGAALGSEENSFGSTLIILHWTRSR